MTELTPAQRLFDLTGDVALVTGASSGLGARFAQVLAAHGARVVAAARRTERLDALARAQAGITPLRLDVTDAAAAEPALAEAERLAGPLTLLVNAAGIAGGRRIIDTSDDQWAAIMRTNVDAVWRLSRAFAARLAAEKRPGAIINVASVAGIMPSAAPAAYGTSKAAVLHMSKAQALDWARFGIRVNAICPGYIASEMTEQFLASPAGQEMIKRIPQRRSGEPSDLDGTLLLLASARASGFMTGAAILVDGGHALT